MIVAVGGDGTVREVVNGMDLEKNILGIIPAGTGNGFRRSINLPGNSLQALRGLGIWPPRKIDLGAVNDTYFINVIGVGFDAAVARQYNASRFLKGYAAYVRSYFSSLVDFEEFPVAINLANGQSYQEFQGMFFLAAVANGSYYGGAMCLAPQARPEDGCLDLCLFTKKTTLEFMEVTLRVLFKKHLRHGSHATMPCTEVEISSPLSLPVQIDGEVTGALPLRIGVLPGAINILCPPLTAES